jgi:hypothetical protein
MMIDQQTANLEGSNVLTSSVKANKKLPSKKPRLLQTRSCPSFTPEHVAKSPSTIGAVCSGSGNGISCSSSSSGSSSSQGPTTAATSESSSASGYEGAKADDNQTSSSGSSKSINEKQQHRPATILGSIISLFEHDDKRKRRPHSERLDVNNKAENAGGGDLKGISKADGRPVGMVYQDTEGSQKASTHVHQPSRQRFVTELGGLPPRSLSCRRQDGICGKSTNARRHSSFHLVSNSPGFPVENDYEEVALEVTIEAFGGANSAAELGKNLSSHLKKHGKENNDNDEISNVTENAGSSFDNDDVSKNEDVDDKNESPCNAASSNTSASARVDSGQLLHERHRTSQHRRRQSTTFDTRASHVSATRGSGDVGLDDNDNNNLHPPRPHPRRLGNSWSTSSSLQIPVAPPPPPFPLSVEPQQQEWSLLDCAKAAGAIYWSLLCAPDVGQQERIV